jgi:hypothetical protein
MIDLVRAAKYQISTSLVYLQKRAIYKTIIKQNEKLQTSG